MRKNCPCDIDGVCPYNAEYHSSCEYWCGEDYDSDEAEWYTHEDDDLFDDPVTY